MMRRTMSSILIAGSMFLALTGCTTSKENKPDDASPTPVPAETETSEIDVSTPLSTATNSSTSTTAPDPMCDWIDATDVILQLHFPAGVTPDSAYSAGFSYPKPPSGTAYFLGRLARQQCEYRVGFYLNETADITAAGIRVIGNTYNEKVILDSTSSASVTFDGGIPVGGKTVHAYVTEIQNQGL